MASHEDTTPNQPFTAYEEYSNAITGHNNGGCSGKEKVETSFMTWAEPLIAMNERFGFLLTETAEQKQLDEQDRILQRIKLPKFKFTTEEKFEEWLEEASETVRSARLCVTLFQLAWSMSCDPASRKAVRRWTPPATHEELIDKIAEDQFQHSRYVFALEDEINAGYRHMTVREAADWLTTRISRYVRICVRRNRRIAITEHRVIESFFRSMPAAVEEKLRFKTETLDFMKMMQQARKIEEELLRLYKGELPQVSWILQNDEEKESTKRPKTDATPVAMEVELAEPPARTRPGKCPHCDGNHFGRQCYHAQKRCRNCNQIGHIARACKNIVDKDSTGRVKTLYERKPGSTTLTHKEDRTKESNITTVQDLMTKVKAGIAAAKEAAKARREKKKTQLGKVTKPRKIHEVLTNEEELEEDDSLGIEDEILNFWTDVAEQIGICWEETADEEGTGRVSARINSQEIQVIPDTGAAQSIMCSSTATNLGVKPTVTAKKLRGLGGTSQGYLTEPLKVTIGDRTIEIEFCVVKDFGTVPLIGKKDLARLHVVVDPHQNSLRDRSTGVLVAWNRADATKYKNHNFKIDSTPPDTITDESLREQHRTTFDRLTQHLEGEVREGVWKLLREYEQCWLRPRAGRVNSQVDIEPTGPPFRDTRRQMPGYLEEALIENIREYERMGIARRSKSEWASNVVCVLKPNGALRIANDYRGANKVIKGDAYPLPLIIPMLQKLSHHNFYCEVDLWWGFWNLQLTPRASEISAFHTPLGLYEWTVLPFGFKVSPCAFQREMERIFEKINGKECFVYMDNIVVAGDAIDETLRKLRSVLEICVEAGLAVKMEKCKFMMPTIELLGHVVSKDGIAKSPKKVQAVIDARPPTTKKELRSFLGLAGFCRGYVPHFAELTSPLSDMLKKDARFIWNPKQREAFALLKEVMAEDVMLSSPVYGEPFVIFADASDIGCGAVLMQFPETTPSVLEFSSHKFNDTQARWATWEREAYAIKWAVDRFSNYLWGQKVIIFTDSKCLESMQKSNCPKHVRWLLYLQEFDVEIKYINGDSQPADFLSRAFQSPDDEYMDTICVPEVFYAQVDLMTNPPRLFTEEDLKRGYDNMTQYEQNHTVKGLDGVLRHVHGGQLFIPPAWRKDVIHWFHATNYGLHAGIGRTKRRMRLWIWWQGWTKDVENFVNGCLVCSRFGGTPRVRSVTGILSKPVPLELISIDFLGSFNLLDLKICICVVIDHCTRYMQCHLYESPTAENAIAMLTDNWVRHYGYPSAVLSDRGACFTSDRYRRFITEELGARVVYTSPYYPQGNAINESCHRIINKAAKSIVYTTVLPDAVSKSFRDISLVYNACPIVTTGVSPYFYLFGMEPPFPGWANFREALEPTARLLKLNETRMRRLVGVMLDNNYEGSIDRGVTPSVGSWVVYYMSPSQHTASRQLYDPAADPPKTIMRAPFHWSPHWSLPAKVVKVQDRVAFLRDLGIDGKLRQIPLSMLRVLPTKLPAPMQDIHLRMIEISTPVRLRENFRARINQPTLDHDLTVDDLIDKALRPHKRPRSSGESELAAQSYDEEARRGQPLEGEIDASD